MHEAVVSSSRAQVHARNMWNAFATTTQQSNARSMCNPIPLPPNPAPEPLGSRLLLQGVELRMQGVGVTLGARGGLLRACQGGIAQGDLVLITHTPITTTTTATVTTHTHTPHHHHTTTWQICSSWQSCKGRVVAPGVTPNDNDIARRGGRSCARLCRRRSKLGQKVL